LANSALQILNASAGSGKTYHLVKEYIKLLIEDNDVKRSFSNIIAMTFTNKASLEMKERIIKALDEISSPNRFDHKADPLTHQIAKETGVPVSDVVNRCRLVLEGILHQYEDFHVMTIDKFNLRLIKSFGRDLDLPSDFEVILDEGEIIEKIVDDLLNQLGEEESTHLNKLLFKYAKSNIDEGITWNFRRNLIDFGAILKSEKNNKVVAQLLEMHLTLETHNLLQGQRASINKKFTSLLEKVNGALHNDGVDTSILPGGGNTVRDIESILKNKTFPIALALIKQRLDGNLNNEAPAGKELPNSLKETLLALNNYWESMLHEYASLDLFLQNFFNMALLQYMARALNTIKKEEQIIRISEFNTLISELIQQENAPFIYERLGTKFKHFLLDEFQDTSHLQWLNLVPLVHESLGHNYRNLIVGDPKQSIYRFKNGVAEQFVALPKIYNPDNNPKIAQKSNYFNEMGSISELKDNWRSSPTIVGFNNTFFAQLKERMPLDSIDFYNSIEQHPKASKHGRIQIVSKEEKIDPKDILPSIITWIEDCKNDGFNPGDICILGGRNKECNSWALGLHDAGYKVVSSDSLLIHSDLKVQLCIAYLNWRLKPSGENEKKRFAELYFRIRTESYEDYKKFIRERASNSGRTYRYFDDEDFLKTHFDGYNAFFFKYENIYDLIQGFYRIMRFEELHNPYLHHLADIIYDFGLKRGPNLKVFLHEYDRKKDKIAVQIPEGDDAIKIMTIHKSKGLEFPVVIIPTLNFSMDIKSSFLVGIDDYIVYKKPSAKDVLQPLIELREREKNQIITDNINLCYVGMTRPVERLYIQNYFENKRFGQLFHETLSNCSIAEEIDGELLVDLNDGERSVADHTIEPSVLFQPTDSKEKLWFPDIAFQDNIELDTTDYLSSEMQFGIQFHLMVSKIEHKSEIENAVQQAISEGEVSSTNKEEIIKKLHALFDLSDYQKLFEGKVDILNEQAILVDELTVIRPDKIILKEDETIIVDYKTGMPSAKDEKQISNYKSTLESMGYPNVQCYLFYSAIHELRMVG